MNHQEKEKLEPGNYLITRPNAAIILNMADLWETLKTFESETEKFALQKLVTADQWQVVTSGKGYDAYEIFTTFCDAVKRFKFLTNQPDDGIY